ncbi:MAG: cellulase family glycosylhydrolase, partial [Flavobacteriaceae bacterium]
MENKFKKNIYRAFLILSAVFIFGLVLLGISSGIAFMNSGADRSSILNLDVDMKTAYMPHVILEDGNNEGRAIDSTVFEKLQRDYLNSWYTRNEALKYNDPILLKDYYTDSAYVKLKRIIELNRSKGVSVEQTTLSHRISLDFYSADGRIAVISDRNVELFRKLYKDGQTVNKSKDTSNYQVVLFLEDNFWRIRHFLRKSALSFTGSAIPELKTFDTEIHAIKGVNYYPKDQAWKMFGERFDLKTISADFKKIKAMGLNTIRIFVPYKEFGAADVSEKHLQQIHQMMDLSASHKIRVILTLFDFSGNYDLADWTLSFRHGRTIVSALKDHPALLGWDLKNEPDLDFENRGKERVLDWLQQLSRIVRSIDRNHPVTIGWSNERAATLLHSEVDYISFHYYGNTAEFQKIYLDLKRSSEGKSVVLQEYGLSSYSGFWNLFSGSDKKQSDYHAEMQKHLEKQHVPFLFWT